MNPNMKKTFNPEEWVEPAAAQAPQHIQMQPVRTTDVTDDIEIVTRRIEAARLDITQGYSNWRDLGFALSDELGENGRDYFHRISRFYSGYSEKEADDQYDKCMRAHGHGITIKTFFQLAKENGISVSVPSKTSLPSHSSHGQSKLITATPSRNPQTEGSEGNGESEGEEDEKLPTFTAEIHDLLPGFFQEIIDRGENEQDADILLLGSIVCISACLPNLSGVYADRSYWPNLYLFVTAQASSGKGRLTLCKHIIQPIHDRLREINEAEVMAYKQKMQEFNANKKKMTMEKPEEPPLRMLFLPANASSTAFIQVLNENDGRGIMFETEGDTLANTFASDYGNYSDHFRKFTHHEAVSYVRRKDREFVYVNRPCVSCVLSGTPKQVSSLIPDAENGLFSRFLFYHLVGTDEWKDVFARRENGTADQFFQTLGSRFHDFYKVFIELGDVEYELTESQRTSFNDWFRYVYSRFPQMLGTDFKATVARLGLMTFRIMMVLSAVRLMDDGDFSNRIVCEQRDFDAAMTMSRALLQHSAYIYDTLPKATVVKAKTVTQKTVRRQLFWDSLDEEFDRQTYIEAAANLQMPLSTAERNIKRWIGEKLIIRKDLGRYKKAK